MIYARYSQHFGLHAHNTVLLGQDVTLFTIASLL